MPISPEAAERRVRHLLQVFAEAEAEILAKIARRLARGIDTEGWAERKFAEIRKLRDDIADEISKLDTVSKREVLKAVGGSYREGVEQAVADLRKVEPKVVAQVNQAAMDALVQTALEPLTRSQMHILRSSVDIYRSTISQATELLTTGTVTRKEAAQRALDRFANRGISGFVDRAGRNWDLASYSEMAIRTASGRAAVQGHVDKLLEHDQDLIIISDAPEECPICRPWEGKVLSISGRSTKVPSLDQARSEGLFHANCRHSTGLYLPGVTKPLKGTADPKRAEDRVQQRALERGVRKWKLRKAVALDEVAAAKADRKVREWQGRLREFVRENDRKRLYYREQIGKAR